MLTHGNLLANIEQVQAVRTARQAADDVVLRRAAAVPHLRAQRRARARARRRRDASLLVERFDPSSALEAIERPRRHRDPGRARRCGRRWSALPGAPADALRDRCAWRRPARRSCRPRSPSAAARALRPRARRGLRPHRGVAGRHQSPPGADATLGSIGRAAARGRGAPGRRRRRRRRSSATPARSGCRGPNVFQGYWNDPEATARVLTPTAGCAPATSRSPTTTASSTSSTGPRTSSSCRASTCSRPRSRRCSLEHPAVAEAARRRRAAPAHRRGGEGLRGGDARARRSTRTTSSRSAPTASPATSARRRSCSSTSCPQNVGGQGAAPRPALSASAASTRARRRRPSSGRDAGSRRTAIAMPTTQRDGEGRSISPSRPVEQCRWPTARACRPRSACCRAPAARPRPMRRTPAAVRSASHAPAAARSRRRRR